MIINIIMILHLIGAFLFIQLIQYQNVVTLYKRQTEQHSKIAKRKRVKESPKGQGIIESIFFMTLFFY